MTFWTYMLHCRGGVFYTGHTDDLDRRIADHQSGMMRGFAQSLLPVELVWSQEFPSRYEALAAERQIKGWSRAKKMALIRGEWDRIGQLAKGKDGPSTSSGRTEFGLAESVRETLLAEAAAAHPLEACGLLLGADGVITAAVPVRNVHPDPATHFELDPHAVIAAHRAARAGGPQLLGYYHSHPTGSVTPSATDCACASGDGRIWAIVAGSAIGWWRDRPEGFEPLPLRVVAG